MRRRPAAAVAVLLGLAAAHAGGVARAEGDAADAALDGAMQAPPPVAGEERPSAALRPLHAAGAGLRVGDFMGGVAGIGFDAAIAAGADGDGWWVLSGTFGRGDLRDEAGRGAPGRGLVEVQSFEAEAVLAGAGYRRHFGNSFYAEGGLGWRQIRCAYRLRSAGTGDALTARARGTSVVATLALGNSWLWENGFYAGVAWVGASAPLLGRFSAETAAAGESAAEIEARQRESEQLARDLSRVTVPGWAVVSVGMMLL